MEFVDTHCHVHEITREVSQTHARWFADKAGRTAESVLNAARTAGVTKLIVIGASLADSELAVEFAARHEGVWASIGIHPHEAKDHLSDEVQKRFAALATAGKVVAVGECGRDYFYNHSPKADQEALLRFQIELALEHDLPLSFHVREAFDDFWPVFESYKGARGVLHSFTDNTQNMERAISYGLSIGVNGIATFTTAEQQLAMYKTIPDEALLLETDAPYLTPKPFRGKVCEPKHVLLTAEFLAGLRGQPLSKEQIAAVWERKTNPVTNRYIGAELTEKAILKFYAQLREPTAYAVAPRASEIAQRAFSATPAEEPVSRQDVSNNAIDFAAGREKRRNTDTAPQEAPFAAAGTETTNPAAAKAAPAEAPAATPAAPAGLDMELIRRQIAGIHSGEAKKGVIINDTIPDVLQQFTELGSTADEAHNLRRAA